MSCWFGISYFTEEWSLYDFGVLLGSTVAMAQFSILSISPAKHLEEILHLSIKTNVKNICYV